MKDVLTRPAVRLLTACLLTAVAGTAAADPPADLVTELEAGKHAGFEAFVLDVAGERRARFVSSKVPAGGLTRARRRSRSPPCWSASRSIEVNSAHSIRR
jgi:hypothetical protein